MSETTTVGTTTNDVLVLDTIDDASESDTAPPSADGAADPIDRLQHEIHQLRHQLSEVSFAVQRLAQATRTNNENVTGIIAMGKKHGEAITQLVAHVDLLQSDLKVVKHSIDPSEDSPEEAQDVVDQSLLEAEAGDSVDVVTAPAIPDAPDIFTVAAWVNEEIYIDPTE